MVTTPKATSKAAATDKAAPKKTDATKPLAGKKTTASSSTASASKPMAVKSALVKTTYAPIAPAAAPVVTPVTVATAAIPAAPEPAPAAAPVTVAVTPAPAKAVVKKPAAKKISAADTPMLPSTARPPEMTTEQRNHYVAVAAFYLAERRGFTLGDPVNDWLAAEAEVDRLLASGHFFS